MVGLLRVGLELFKNAPFLELSESYDDLGYGVVFTSTLFALLKKASYRLIIFTFYIPLILLLCVTLFLEGGLASPLENNIHVGLMIIALTMQSKDARKFTVFLTIGAIASLLATEWRYEFLKNYSNYSTSSFNYIFMTSGVICVVFYAKWMFEGNRKKLSRTHQKLEESRRLLEASKIKLEAQTKELESLNKQLEDKVDERAAILNNQRDAMKQYLDVTLKELQKDYLDVRNLVEVTTQDPKNEVSQMMIKSSHDLDHEITSLVRKLKTEQ